LLNDQLIVLIKKMDPAAFALGFRCFGLLSGVLCNSNF